MIKENIKLALASLKMNKLRSILTMLGIIIGIMAITAIVFIGNAMTASVSKEMGSFGTRNINISLQKKDSDVEYFDDGSSSGSEENQPLSEDMISEEMIEDMKTIFGEEIEGISLTQRLGQAEVKEGDNSGNVSISGVNSEYIKANQVNMMEGSFISDIDVRNKSNTVVISNLLGDKLYPGEKNLLGKEIKVYTKDSINIYQVGGVYKYDNSAMNGVMSEKDVSTEIYIPVTTTKEDMVEKNYSSLTVIGSDEKNIENLTRKIQHYFDDIYKNNVEWQVFVMNMSSMLDMVTGTMKKISLAISAIAGISLLVGGIGVMNIMLVSVTERTREIGTKKALGAKEIHIKLQFVIESIIISFIGGSIGLGLGIGIGLLISKIFKVPFTFSPVFGLSSVLFATLIGMLFGYYPAKKAAKLNPIDALRYE